MNDDIKSFIINIAASLFLVAAAAVVDRLIRVLPSRRLWRIANPQTLHICISTSAQTDTGEYVRLSSGLGQIRALSLLSPSLYRAYKEFSEQRILMSEDRLADRYEGDLIVLGGPKNNRVAKILLSALGDRLPVTIVEPTVTWHDEGNQVVYTAKRNENELEEDYGVIIRATNPYNSQRKVIIFFGTHTYGTTAAARLFLSEFTKLKYAFFGDFVALVKAPVRDRHVVEPVLLHVKRLGKQE